MTTFKLLKSFFKSILPNYDVDRVYVSDIKKVITWYQSLLSLALGHLMEEDALEANTKKEAKPQGASVLEKDKVNKNNEKSTKSTKKIKKNKDSVS